MSELHNVWCPQCGWRFYVDPSISIQRLCDCLCPKCKHEFPPEASSKPKQAERR